jgi:hypothetical protein
VIALYKEWREEYSMSLGTILLIILVLMLLGAIPALASQQDMGIRADRMARFGTGYCDHSIAAWVDCNQSLYNYECNNNY